MKNKIEELEKHCKILKQRIETEENNIPYSSMIRILSKIEDRFNIMIEEIFGEMKNEK